VGRGYFVFKDNQLTSEWKQPVQLATEWYLKPSVLAFNCFSQSKGEFGWYRFMAPPGVQSMFIQSISRPKVWVNGIEVLAIQIESNPERYTDVKIPVWKIVFSGGLMNSSSIAFKIEIK